MASLPPLLLLLLVAATAASAVSVLPGCRSTCGGVEIPYPFGIGPNCSLEGFGVTCNTTDHGEQPFLSNVKIEPSWYTKILSISVPLGQLRMIHYVTWQCYNKTSRSNDHIVSYPTNMENSPYRFNDVLNKFTVIGCDTLAYIQSFQSNDTYMSGCVSMCSNEESLSNGTCSGRGCCQTSIPKNLKYYKAWFDSNFNNSRTDWSSNRCSFAVLTEASSFQYQTDYSTTLQFWYKDHGNVPVVVDWGIGDQNCSEVLLQRNKNSSYACLSQNSVCVDSSNGPGYLCNCSHGYQGNPYLENGCQDIDECTDPAHPKSCSSSAKCQNLPGTYSCSCPPGTHGEPYNGTCTPDQKLSSAVKVVIGTSSGLVFVLFCSMCICIITERRKHTKDKEKYFREHGGRLLLEEIKEKEGLAFKIFAEEELEKATNKFDQRMVLGRGGYGIVYKGVLQDKRIVAIKKSKVVDENQKKEFGKEMLILSQINHRNIVKLLGCCLEVEVPMLVYEFIPNGTLFQLIHNNNPCPISLANRLRIAYESADALAYLHSSASPPIIHGDVKTCNILLDENYNAKITDFGASRLIPKDEDQIATLVQGTCGYLDPEYLQTCQLTDKSDVYSFGVVLLEMLTGRKAIYFEGSKDGICLAATFFSAINENRFTDILDSRVKNEGDLELIQELSELIRRCLDLNGDGRPGMKEVAEELNKLRKFKEHPWAPHSSEEITTLLGETSSDHGTREFYDQEMDTTTSYTSGSRYSVNIESGR